jgi:hypothetical protein
MRKPIVLGTPVGVLGLLMLFTAASVAPASSRVVAQPLAAMPATNHLDANTSSLDGGLGAWLGWYSADVGRATSPVHSGAGALRVNVTSPWGWGASLNNWPGFIATAGTKTITFWGKAASDSSGGDPESKMAQLQQLRHRQPHGRYEAHELHVAEGVGGCDCPGRHGQGLPRIDW